MAKLIRWPFTDHQRNFLSTLALNYPLTTGTDLDLSLRSLTQEGESSVTGDQSWKNTTRDESYGGSAKFTWRTENNVLAVGGDFDHCRTELAFTSFLIDPVSGVLVASGPDVVEFRSDKWGLFVNDTLTLGPVAITPGIRYDQTPQTGNFISPSLGLTWSLSDKTVLRAYAGKGYSLPVLIPGATQEKVLTFQAGFETTLTPWLWLKTTLFRNELSDVVTYDLVEDTIRVKLAKRLKQGAEVETKTVPVYNTSLSAGYTFIDITDPDTGQILNDNPRQILKLGLHYNGSFRAALLGRYVRLNAAAGNDAKYNAIICDFNVSKKVLEVHETSLEIFFNGHNIFNGAQYGTAFFKNTPRWLEGGITVNF